MQRAAPCLRAPALQYLEVQPVQKFVLAIRRGILCIGEARSLWCVLIVESVARVCVCMNVSVYVCLGGRRGDKKRD